MYLFIVGKFLYWFLRVASIILLFQASYFSTSRTVPHLPRAHSISDLIYIALCWTISKIYTNRSFRINGFDFEIVYRMSQSRHPVMRKLRLAAWSNWPITIELVNSQYSRENHLVYSEDWNDSLSPIFVVCIMHDDFVGGQFYFDGEMPSLLYPERMNNKFISSRIMH